MCMRTNDSRYLRVGYDENQQFETCPCLLWQSDFMLGLLQGISSFYEVSSSYKENAEHNQKQSENGRQKGFCGCHRVQDARSSVSPWRSAPALQELSCLLGQAKLS